MALTTTQVNAAYVALLGRAAEGQAANWAGSFASDADLARAILSVDSDFADTNKLTNEQFVDYIYLNYISKPADAEGKAFWLALLNTTNNREALVSQFIAAAKANEEDISSFEAANSIFIETLYQNLLGRSSDTDGLKYWQDAMSAGMSQSALVAAFISAALSNTASDDYATAAAKLNVANAVTSSFYGFKAGLSDADKEAALSEMKNIITKTDANTTVEDEQDDINNLVGNYQSNTNKGFTIKTDKLEGSETSATTFVGSVNLVDKSKSTLTKADSATGDKAFTNTLKVNVSSDKDHNNFKFADHVSGDNLKNITNLEINNGSANVTLADTDVKVFTNNISLTGTGADKVTVSGSSVSALDTGAGDDTITLNQSGSVTTLKAGAGNDTVSVASGATIETVDLGAGNDTISLASGAVTTNATIDGGAGRDTLKLDASAANVDFSAIKTISGIEIIELTGATAATSGAKISYDSIKDTNAKFALSLNTGSGTLTIDAGDNATINLTGVTALAEIAKGSGGITISNVGSGDTAATVKLNSKNGIAETIKVVDTAKNENAVKITGIGADDKLDAIAAASDISSVSGDASALSSGATISANKLYFVDANKDIKTADDAVAALSGVSGVSGNAIIAFNNGKGTAYIFAYKATDTTIDNTELTLVGIVDNEINGGDSASGGVITFA